MSPKAIQLWGFPLGTSEPMSAASAMSPNPQPEPLFRFNSLSAELRAELEDISLEIPIDEGGGSSLTKMLVLASLTVGHDLRHAAEIGVYRGRALLALGATMRALGRGQVIGIDPYTVEAAIQRDDHRIGIDLQTWPYGVGWEDLYDSVRLQLEQRELTTYCRLDRRTSSEAATDIPPSSIELLHIDGNHDRDAVASDLALYLPKMRLGGFVAMDDITWPSIQPLFEEVAARQELVLQLYDPGTFSTFDDFGVVHIVSDVMWTGETSSHHVK